MIEGIKLLNINIQGDRHLDRVTRLIARESPDVLCLQELLEKDRSILEHLGFELIYLPNTLKDSGHQGIALGVRRSGGQVLRHSNRYYDGMSGDTIPLFDRTDPISTNRRGFIMATTIFDKTEYTIGTTHFTWTPHGESPGAPQIADIPAFLNAVKSEPPHVICGDFNIPRNINPLYEKLTSYYTDNIPLAYTSSLDKNLHREGNNPSEQQLFDSFMVDYLFSRPPYVVTDVALTFGVSDHAAITGRISTLT